jgi:hypothetical protein
MKGVINMKGVKINESVTLLSPNQALNSPLSVIGPQLAVARFRLVSALIANPLPRFQSISSAGARLS